MHSYIVVFQECDEVNPEFPNFNFNTSHHGDYVALASEPLCLVGLDIVSPGVPPGKETILEFIRNFSQYFSAWEWNCIVTAGTNDEILVEFYRYDCTVFIWFSLGNILSISSISLIIFSLHFTTHCQVV